MSYLFRLQTQHRYLALQEAFPHNACTSVWFFLPHCIIVTCIASIYFRYWMGSLLNMKPCPILEHLAQRRWDQPLFSEWINEWEVERSGTSFNKNRIDEDFWWILIQPLTCGISSKNRRPAIHLRKDKLQGLSSQLHGFHVISCHFIISLHFVSFPFVSFHFISFPLADSRRWV